MPAPLTPAVAALIASVPAFEFHNNFWLNLHHFLYSQAVARQEEPPARADQGWLDAVAYYQANLVSRDLLFDEGMQLIDRRLGKVERPEQLQGTLDTELENVLVAAAPIYREHLWPEHERANGTWIESVRPLLDAHGPAVMTKLAELFREEWPEGSIRVDVLVYANWAGAYTSRDPSHIRIGTLIPRRESPVAALETLIHESSHLIMSRRGAINTRIAAECERRGIQAPRGLWHAILFYTVGELVRRSPAKPDDYVPYAYRHGLYDRPAWRGYRGALELHWQDYVDGDRSLEEAIKGMIEFLAAEQPPPRQSG